MALEVPFISGITNGTSLVLGLLSVGRKLPVALKVITVIVAVALYLTLFYNMPLRRKH